MIHLCMLGVALVLAWGLRLCLWTADLNRSWRERWIDSLRALLLPPLPILGTLIAILCMGPDGQMAGVKSGCISYGLAWILLGISLSVGVGLGWRGWLSWAKARACSLEWIQGHPSRILNTSIPFAAQIGFWQPELVISRGLQTSLSDDHMQAVLVHEQAHLYYRDTFWFFGLGWIRTLTCWLPYTEALWCELLTLRELRADRWAAQRIEPLLLAEALLQVVVGETEMISDPLWSAAVFSSAPDRQGSMERLQERVQALLDGETIESTPVHSLPMHWLLLALLPLMTIPFHS